jgi:hypothetical protein
MTSLEDLAVTSRLLPSPGQPISDANDAWRSLLLGAPPTVV